ncbi:MAG: hypothetical protein L6Q54_05510 [Leptospiraceae bacterium]|nr:hypothetical protein [Leptospiraceae bacterium]MCK6380695.1 hypothetical protein [Leptospiraceae bacterium]NUM42043.1 hypothetical protein [Leptospiraceae bacterium]
MKENTASNFTNFYRTIFFKQKYFLFLFLVFQIYIVSTNSSVKNLEIDSNSDLIFPISFFTDIENGTSIKNWALPPAPSFFPDLFLFYIAWKITGGLIHFSFFIYVAFFECILFLSLFYLLKNSNQKTKAQDNNITLNRIFGFFFSLNIVFLFSPSQFSLFLLPGYHGFVVAFGCFLSIAIFLKRKYAIVSILSFLFIFSDGQIILQCIIPALIVLSWNFWNKKISKKDFFLMVIAILSGWIFSNIFHLLLKKLSIFQIPEVPFFSIFKSIIQKKLILSNFQSVMNFIKSEWITNSKETFWMIFFCFYFVLLIFLPSNWKKNKNLTFLIFISILCTNFVQFFFGVWGGMRYSWFLVYLPFFALLFSDISKKQITPFGFVILFLLCLQFQDLYFKSESILKNPYPKKIQCLDNIANEFRLEFGFSDYWNSKYVMLYSKKKLALKQLTKNLDEYKWIYNPEWTNKNENFNFIITNRLDKDQIHSKFSYPKEIRNCEDLEIYIYNKNELNKF